MTASSIPMPRLPSAAVAAAAVWFGLALLAGATGFLARLPFPGPQLIILTLVVATFAAGTLVPALRDWIGAVPIRALIGINAIRFIGAWFLVIAARGELAPVFANRAGWGDIATAALALVLFAAGEPRTATHRALAHAWNAFGLLDLVVAGGTNTRSRPIRKLTGRSCKSTACVRDLRRGRLTTTPTHRKQLARTRTAAGRLRTCLSALPRANQCTRLVADLAPVAATARRA